jgi:hypothetical protein
MRLQKGKKLTKNSSFLPQAPNPKHALRSDDFYNNLLISPQHTLKNKSMKKKPTQELKQEYEILKFLLTFHQENKTSRMSPSEFEDYVNAALEMMLEIKKELEKRGEKL